jgi:putative SOS response-associated peptidase YedK
LVPNVDTWLGSTGGEAGWPLLIPAPAGSLVATAASTRVNSVRNDDPECLTPTRRQLLLFDVAVRRIAS